jgi:NAD(P)-dependent dehydrogenase (short-subunit alcohol dehydrogenase family)
MLVRQWANILEAKGVTVVVIHPGLVATDMLLPSLNPAAAISVDESVKGMLEVVGGIDAETDTSKGIFSNEKGVVFPW